MKTQFTFLILILLFCCSFLQGQKLNTDSLSSGESSRYSKNKQYKFKGEVKNIIGFTPTKASYINGLALGYNTSPKNNLLVVRGLNIEINPLPLLVSPLLLLHIIAHPNISNSFFPDSAKTNCFIHGLNISSLVGFDVKANTSINGINIAAVSSHGQQLNGVSISIASNRFYRYNGLLIAGISNIVNEGNGLQIALFNSCKDCHGVQIGLLNKMGKRTLPFINMRF
jgi:hypothetical protein